MHGSDTPVAASSSGGELAYALPRGFGWPSCRPRFKRLVSAQLTALMGTIPDLTLRAQHQMAVVCCTYVLGSLNRRAVYRV